MSKWLPKPILEPGREYEEDWTHGDSLSYISSIDSGFYIEGDDVVSNSGRNIQAVETLGDSIESIISVRAITF